MPIYLYVKTHNKTGLKYLGKTESNDPHKYPGSGTYWKSHLKKHGYNYTTEIICECQTSEELIEKGQYYSTLWNVVQSNDWANLKPESGDGGSMPGILNGMYGKTHTVTVRNKLAQLRKDTLTGKTYSELYGEEKALRLKEDRSTKLKQYYSNSPQHHQGGSNPNAKKYLLISPNNTEFIVIGNLKQFCNSHGLDIGKVIDLVKGRRKDNNYKGWRGNYIED